MAFNPSTIWYCYCDNNPWLEAETEAEMIAIAESVAVNAPGMKFDIFPVTRRIYTED